MGSKLIFISFVNWLAVEILIRKSSIRYLKPKSTVITVADNNINSSLKNSLDERKDYRPKKRLTTSIAVNPTLSYQPYCNKRNMKESHLTTLAAGLRSLSL